VAKYVKVSLKERQIFHIGEESAVLAALLNVGGCTGPLNHTSRTEWQGLRTTDYRIYLYTYRYVPGVLYICFSTGGGDYNRWTYTNGYVNSPAWHMHYRVNQVRNVMVHATPRTLTNRFLPLYPRWTGSHTPHTVEAKKVPRYTTVRLARLDRAAARTKGSRNEIIEKKENAKEKSAKNQDPKRTSFYSTSFCNSFEHNALRSFDFHATLSRDWFLRGEVGSHEYCVLSLLQRKICKNSLLSKTKSLASSDTTECAMFYMY